MSDVKPPARQKPASARSHAKSDDAASIDRKSGPPCAAIGVPRAAIPESELEPDTASEVRTKLDLARQFLDMGDPESARHMLDEVLNEGDAQQKEDAQRLIDSMP